MPYKAKRRTRACSAGVEHVRTIQGILPCMRQRSGYENRGKQVWQTVLFKGTRRQIREGKKPNRFILYQYQKRRLLLMKSSHMTLMALGCLAPIATVFALPLLGYTVPTLLYLLLPLVCPISMFLVCKSMDDKCSTKNQKRETL